MIQKEVIKEMLEIEGCVSIDFCTGFLWSRYLYARANRVAS